MSAHSPGMGDEDEWARLQVRERADLPALLRDRHLRIVASNPLARALSPGFLEGVNLARYTFLDASAHEPSLCWGEAATEVAAMLRESLDHHNDDGAFRHIVGELSAQSDRFATAWADETVPTRSGVATFDSTPVGSLRLTFTEEWVDEGRQHALMLFRGADRQATADLKTLADFIASDPSRD